MNKNALAIFLVLGAWTGAVQAATVTFNASGTWTVPAGVTSATVEAWGHGGAGGGVVTNNGTYKGGGGAGGQYVRSVVTVTPGANYTVTVGTGGTGSTGNGLAGGDSIFGANLVVAKGGAGGLSYENGGTGGVGSTAGGVGTVVYAGGSGSNGGASATGGAGGGGAGSSGAGGDASGDTPGTGTATGGGAGGAGLTSRGTGTAGSANGGGGAGGYVTPGNNTNQSGGAGGNAQILITYTVVPLVASINTASTNPTAANTSVTWTVVFDSSVTGVDATDFSFVTSGSVTGASITSVTGIGTTYTVTADTGTGTVGTLALRLVDNNSIVNASGTALGGPAVGDGTFTGQAYTLIVPVCSAGMLFCDDFERALTSGGSNTAGVLGTATMGGAWTVSPLGNACAGVASNTGCAGVDSYVPPWSTATSPRANATRSMFTRWSNVVVTSPVINLAGRTGAKLSFWLRRGSDCFSEWPGNNQAGCGAALAPYTSTPGEEFQVQYKNNAGVWIVLVQYPTDATPGEIFTPEIGLPDDALHSTFQFRFVQPGGSGSNSTNGGAPGVRGYDYWHVDDVTLIEVPAVTFTGPFCDTFEGDLSRWDMTGTGDVRIGSTYFEYGAHDMDLRWNTVSATTKSTDLSTDSGSNVISFWVKRGTGVVTTVPNTTGSEFPDTAAKGLKFEYLNNLGTWVQLGTTFAGGGTQGQVFLPSAATNNFVIPADAKHNKFKLRITMLSGSGIYDQDYWHVDDVCVGKSVVPADLSLTKTSTGTFLPGNYVTYTLTATNLGPNLDPGPITIIDTLPTGLSYASGSAGWTCSAAGQVVTCRHGGALSVNASVALTLTATVDTSVVGGVITNTATVGGQANDTNLTNNTATKSDTVFVPTFVFTDKACVLDGPPVTVIGQGSQCNAITWSPQTAGQALGNFYITKVNAAMQPVALNATNPTTVNMRFGLSCRNPATNAGVQATFDDGTNTRTLPLCEANAATPTSWSSTLALSFPAATPSVGLFNFNYGDVGEVELFMQNGADATQMGSSGFFVVKPAGFVLSSIKCTTANAANCGAGALAMTTAGDNPAAATASGASFITAGKPFSVTVRAVNAIGNSTPNFGKEAPPESVKLTPVNAVANMVTPPAIAGTFGTFTSGVATGTAFTWEEAGIITLVPGVYDINYLGAGDTQCDPALANYGGSAACPASGNVGRFYPDHFNTAVVLVSGVPMPCATGLTCPTDYNGMVYSGQPYTLTTTALSVGGNPTTNYNTTTGFSRAVTLSARSAPGAVSAPTGAGSLAVTSTSAFATGVASESAEKYSFDTVLTAPTNVYVRAAEASGGDGVTSLRASSVEGGVAVVSGQVRVANVYGSELLPLSTTATVQYYTANGWTGNLADSVTMLALASPYDVLNTSGAVTGTTAASFAAPTDPSCLPYVSGRVCNDLASIRLAKPTAGGAGVATITPSVVGCASPASCYLPVISGTAAFGVYKNNNNFIYRRER